MTRARSSLSEKLYAALLRWYPRDFRREFAPDMRDLFRDHLRSARARAGLRGVALLWMRTIPDLVFTGLHEHEDEMFQAVVQDARYAVRILRKHPAFTAIAIAVVALGTGAVSTIYSVANAIAFRPIPGVVDPSSVVTVQRMRSDGGRSRSSSYPLYEQLATQAKTVDVAGWDNVPLTLSTGGEGVRGQGNLVSGNYFDVLGVKPAFGRFFTAEEARVADTYAVTVISHELWQRQFAGDSAVLGRKLLINGRPFTVVGVTPRGFTGLFPVLRTDAWVPLVMQAAVRRAGSGSLTNPAMAWVEIFGRPARGATRAAAAVELSGLMKRFADGVEAGPLPEMAAYTQARLATISGFGDDGRSVIAFFAALLALSALVMVIASVNVASMLLARAVVRRREMAIRVALGAGRARIARQLLTECLILFAAGGALGVALAIVGTRLLSRIPLPVDLPLSIDASPDVGVIVVTLLVALLTGIVFGLAPALEGSRADVASTMRGDTAGSGTRSRLRTALTVGQIAASLVLLMTSGLFARALVRGQQVDPGYDIEHVATAAFDVELSGYDSTRGRAFLAALRDRMAALPGVTTVAYTSVVPLSANSSGDEIAIPGSGARLGRKSDRAFVNDTYVDAAYFDAVCLPIATGRGLSATDVAGAPRVAVVSQRFADRFWPGENVIGHSFVQDSSVITIVGVVRDVKFAQLDERTMPFMYLPLAQHWRSDVNLLVRTTGDAASLIAPIRAAVHEMDAAMPVPAPVTLRRSAAVVLLPQRFAVIVTATLGAVGLFLAAIGLYGVLSFATARRTREIGVRMALGAASGDVVRMVVGEGLRVVGIGMAIGIVIAALASRALAPFLFGVSPLDAMTYIGTSAVLATTAFIASLLPARRAANVDPMMALRQD